MISAIYLFVFPCISLIAGLAYSYELRKLLARMQHRRGPYLIMPRDLRRGLGVSRFWQPLYDIIKLWHKQTLIQESSIKTWFILSPIIALLLSIVSTWFLVIPGLNSPLSWTPLSAIIVFMILAFVPVFWVVGAASSGSPWALIGARREAELFLAYEIPLISAIISVAILASDLTIRGIVAKQGVPYLLVNPLAGVAFMLAILGKLHLKPFDIPEADVEIVSGPFTEYSGKMLALIEVTKVLLLFQLSGLFVDLFLAGGWPSSNVLGALFFFALAAIVVFLLTLISALMPRYRIDQAVSFYTKLTLVISILSLAWSSIYVILL
ncbi:MAG: NADH-quinone oxidoreductase subunit H [Thermoprotei archaeon]|nr:NADH-quinone oxidoreductase subunit H [Thermoprotei archaeon]